MSRVIEVAVPLRVRIARAQVAAVVQSSDDVFDVRVERGDTVDRAILTVATTVGPEREGEIRAAIAGIVENRPEDEVAVLRRELANLKARVDELAATVAAIPVVVPAGIPAGARK